MADDEPGAGVVGTPAERSLAAIIAVIVRHRVLVAGLAFGVAATAVAVALNRSVTYTAVTRFAAQAPRSAPAASNLAAQLGLAQQGGGAQSPDFYIDLLASQDILGRVAEARYRVGTESGPQDLTLVELFGSGMGGPRQQRNAAVRRLRGMITAEASPRTGIVTLRVKSERPELSAAIAATVLEELTRFNLETRQSQAALERDFLRQRLADAGAELTAAEDRHQRFLQENRDFRTAPRLTIEQDRLARAVAMRQEVFSGVAQAFEQARIEALRESPVITVIDRPEPPLSPDGRGLLLAALTGLVLGGLLGVGAAFGRDFLRRAMRHLDGA